MQTELTIPELTRAESQREKLVAAAGEAKAEAERWRVTFEREPTAQALAEYGVHTQKAKNAAAAVEAFDRDVLGPLRDRERLARRERDEAAMRSIVDRIGEARDEARDALAAAGKALGTLVSTLGEFDRRLQSSSVAFSIEHAQIGRVLERIQREVEIDGGRLAIEFFNTSQVGELRASITLDADVPHSLR